jgi:hypothetical protein
MRIPLLPLISSLAALTFLSACVSPAPKLAQGTSVHFHNSIDNEITVQRVGMTVFGNDRYTEQVPELAPMMRRVVMEEAARAGLKCVYTSGPLPEKSGSGFEKFMVGADRVDVDSFVASSKATTGFIALKAGNTSVSQSAAVATSGFSIVEQKAPFLPATPMVVGGTAVNRYEKTAENPTGKRLVKIAGNLPFIFGGYEAKGDWKSATASARLKALKLWELQFRTAVAFAMGSPAPVMNPPLELKKL